MNSLSLNQKDAPNWFSQSVILASSFALCLFAVMSMLVLYVYMNREFNYMTFSLQLQKGYNQAIPLILNMELVQQSYVLEKTPEKYLQFEKLQERLQLILQNIDHTVVSCPELGNCGKDFIARIKEQANKLRENIDLAHNFNISNVIYLQDYIPQYSKLTENFLEQESKIFDKHNGSIYRIEFLFIIAMGLFIASMIAFTFAIFYNFKNDIKILNASKQKLNQQNIQLETMVKERTQELETARLFAEKERQRVELLLQDTSHRIGNSLATVASLLGMQANRTKNEKVANALISARDRIQTIAAAHRRLRLGNDMETTKVDDFLHAVINDIEFSMPADVKERIEISTDLQSFSLSSRDATTLGIVLGELLTNAIKHAFPAPRKGEIHVFFGKKQGGPLSLIIQDNGIGISDNKVINNDESKNKNNSKKEANKVKVGLGQLVAKQLCLQFNTEPVYENKPTEGTKVSINLSAIEIEEKDANKF